MGQDLWVLRKECVTWNGRPKGLLASPWLSSWEDRLSDQSGSVNLQDGQSGKTGGGMWRVWDGSRFSYTTCGVPMFFLECLQSPFVYLTVKKRDKTPAKLSQSNSEKCVWPVERACIRSTLEKDEELCHGGRKEDKSHCSSLKKSAEVDWTLILDRH